MQIICFPKDVSWETCNDIAISILFILKNSDRTAILGDPIFTERGSNMMKIHFRVVLLSLILNSFASLQVFPVLGRGSQKWMEKKIKAIFLDTFPNID